MKTISNFHKGFHGAAGGASILMMLMTACGGGGDSPFPPPLPVASQTIATWRTAVALESAAEAAAFPSVAVGAEASAVAVYAQQAAGGGALYATHGNIIAQTWSPPRQINDIGSVNYPGLKAGACKSSVDQT